MILWIKTNHVHDYGWSLKGHGWICAITMDKKGQWMKDT
jgi:hypothetical protein